MRIITFLVAFLIGSICNGQRDTVYTNEVLVTFSPSAFLNPYPGIQFGIEKFIAEDKTIELEVARLMVVDLMNERRRDNNTRLEKRQGLRLKLGYKKFISDRGIFLATIYYRRTQHDFEEWVFRDQGNFEELVNYSSSKTLLGPTIGFGLSNKLKNSFYIETAMNVGVGGYAVRRSDLQDDNFIEGRILDFYHAHGNYIYPIIGFSLKIKYGL